MKAASRVLMAIGFAFAAAVAVALVFEMDVVQRQHKGTITILRGENAFQISGDLKSEGCIGSRIMFLLYVLKDGDLKKMKAGEYDLSNLGDEAIVEKLSKGQTVARFLTITPGQTVAVIAANLQKIGVVGAGAFVGKNNSSLEAKYRFLNDISPDGSLEGFLFPDTYQIEPKTTADDITSIMLDNFDKKLTSELRQEIANQQKTIYSVITMASIVEREVKTPADKRVVAGILWKRIGIGMPLQVDSAVLYDNNGVFDKTKNSPYNTYLFAGLPPGPICNPGMDSIEAAIYPQKTDYLYYLSAADGTTVFSKTYDEHLANRSKYILK
jgi:UPF0755 protein